MRYLLLLDNILKSWIILHRYDIPFHFLDIVMISITSMSQQIILG